MRPNSLFPPDLEVISDPVLEATAELENCARVLDLEDWVLLRLKQFEQETTLHTILRSAGVSPAETVVHPLTALWVRHCSARGPAIVPLAISGDAFLNSVRAKAMRTTWTAALYGLDAGGAAAAVILDPKQHSEHELREAVHKIGQAMAELGECVGAPSLPLGAPHLPQSADVGLSTVVIPDGLNPIEMEWLNASFRAAGDMQTRISGKLSSNEERETRNEEPIAFGFTELIRCASGRLAGQRIAIQGFDPTCRSLMGQLHRAGARIVAVADSSGGLRDPLGLDPAALIPYARENDVLLGYPSAEAVVNADVLESDCDVLVLAAGEYQINSVNAAHLRPRIILEVASNAITPTAKTELSIAGKTVVSNLICGGVTLLHYCTEPERTTLAARPDALMRRHVRRTWKQIQDASAKWQLPLHQAAEILAIERVAEVVRARGI